MQMGSSGRCTRTARGVPCPLRTGARRHSAPFLRCRQHAAARGSAVSFQPPGGTMNRLHVLAAAGLVALAGCADQPTTPHRGAPRATSPGFSIAVTRSAPPTTWRRRWGDRGSRQNVTYSGATAAAGTYTGGAANVGFDGIVLATGTRANAAGPNYVSRPRRNSTSGRCGRDRRRRGDHGRRGRPELRDRSRQWRQRVLRVRVRLGRIPGVRRRTFRRRLRPPGQRRRTARWSETAGSHQHQHHQQRVELLPVPGQHSGGRSTSGRRPDHRADLQGGGQPGRAEHGEARDRRRR